jgi:hypothetical protein
MPGVASHTVGKRGSAMEGCPSDGGLLQGETRRCRVGVALDRETREREKEEKIKG